MEEIPQFGFQLSEVTTDLQGRPGGVADDYERKFLARAKNINRCATMVPWRSRMPGGRSGGE
ncbi:MAG: hypothetical protein ACLVH7_15520 [Flavonifractor plautii]